MSVIKVENLYFTYDKECVLRDINFTVDDGEFVAIIGPNGGGKSTLVKLIMGELTPIKGSVKVFGKEPILSREDIGYVPQNTNININFPIKVVDVVMMGNLNRHQEDKSFLDRLFTFKHSQGEKKCAYSSLERVGMKEYLHRNIGTLSGGQRQRVMIARALCSHPKLLILDEPTSSIDIDGQREIYTLLKELNQEISIVVVSHDIATIGNYATKVIYMNGESFIHDLSKNLINLPKLDGSEHFCQIELMQMIGDKNDN